MSLLDKIPDSGWFFCFPLSLGVFCITVLGIIHPLFWISVMRIYRSEVFVFMYVLVGFWSILSCALLYGIFAESSCIYVFWIWYTMAFTVTMAVMMFLLFCGFCVLGMRRKSICALLGLIYYIVSLYFVVVVNKQRKEVFGIQEKDCGECSDAGLRFHELQDIPNMTTPRAWLFIEPNTTTDTTTTTALTTTIATTTTKVTAPAAPMLRAIEEAMRTVAMAALLAAGSADVAPTEHTTESEQTTGWVVDPHRRELSSAEPKTLPSSEKERLAAIARLSELLLQGNECRMPRKPTHGRFTVTGHRGAAMRITLRCDEGYRESSVSTECKYNWWDRPIPQCRKRREPPPLPHPGGGCVMPEYPKHGEYRVADHARARPGDRVVGDNVILLVNCDDPYRAVDPYVICVEGRWRHAPPSCQKHCKLIFDPTVQYKCLKEFKDEFLACGAWQPDGATVAAACKPGHAHRGPFRYMRCKGDAWDHVVSCLPNANFTT